MHSPTTSAACAFKPGVRRAGLVHAPGRRTGRRSLLAAAALTVITLAQTATPAAAADRFWTCPTNNFTNGNCWSNPGTVVSTDNLLIRPNGANPLNVNFPGTAAANTSLTIQSLTVTGAGGSGSAPTLNISSGTLNMSNYFEVGGGATVAQTGGSVNPSLSSAFRNSGTYNLSGGVLGTWVVDSSNAGSLNVSGTGVLRANNFDMTGVLSITGPNAVVEIMQGTIGDYSSRGLVQLNNGATLYVQNGLTNTGTINATNSTIRGLDWNRGGVLVAGNVEFPSFRAVRNGGGISVADLASANLSAGLVNDASGVITLSGQQSRLANGGTGASLVNNGTLQGRGFVAMPVDHRGRISATNSGFMAFTDRFVAAQGSSLNADAGSTLQFDGRASLEGFAFITGSGTATFRGRLDVGAAGAAGRLTSLGKVGLHGGPYMADIFGTRAGFDYDQLEVKEGLFIDFGSTLELNSGSFVAQIGQSFQLFDAGSINGTFAGINSGGLLLANGARLDMARLYVDGTLAVVAVPEPATWAMAIAGILGLLARRRLGRLQEHGA